FLGRALGGGLTPARGAAGASHAHGFSRAGRECFRRAWLGTRPGRVPLRGRRLHVAALAGEQAGLRGDAEFRGDGPRRRDLGGRSKSLPARPGVGYTPATSDCREEGSRIKPLERWCSGSIPGASTNYLAKSNSCEGGLS